MSKNMLIAYIAYASFIVLLCVISLLLALFHYRVLSTNISLFGIALVVTIQIVGSKLAIKEEEK